MIDSFVADISNMSGERIFAVAVARRRWSALQSPRRADHYKWTTQSKDDCAQVALVSRMRNTRRLSEALILSERIGGSPTVSPWYLTLSTNLSG